MSELSDTEKSQLVMSRAVMLLGRREYAEHELVVKVSAKLAAKGIDSALVETVVSSLKDQGYQSDERFAEVFVRSRLSRGYGPLVIRQELRQRGIDAEQIDQLLDQSPEFWSDQAQAITARKFRNATPAENARKARFLARRGYPSDVIYGVLS